MELHGRADARFSLVREVFAEQSASGEEPGASLAVIVGGSTMVDLWFGVEEDTIVNVWSTTKTMTALATLVLVQRGVLDLDAPVARVWPEFSAREVTIDQVLSHTSGLSGFARPLTVEELYDWDDICASLAAQSPWWEPGTASGYHVLTQGYLLGEIVRRTTGDDLDTFFRREIAQPIDADFQFCVGPHDDRRVGDLVPPPSHADGSDLDPSSVAGRTIANPILTGAEPRSRAWRRALVPAAAGFGNARSIARVHAAWTMSPDLLAIARTERVSGIDLVLGEPARFAAGFGLPCDPVPFSPNPGALAGGGWGGSLVVIDPEAELVVAYVPSRMAAGGDPDPRGQDLVDMAVVAL